MTTLIASNSLAQEAIEDGDRLSLKAGELMCSHTTWHVGDAVVLKWSAFVRR